MGDSANRFLNFLMSLPLSKKISVVFVFSLLVSGFALMFFWTNQENYQVMFNNLSPEDGGAVIAKLKERNVLYKVEANGTIIMVPADKVHELRLALAGDGLPNGGNVGFEIFDHSDFGTTQFVQELNYRRALQGELARTISQFKEVKGSRVFIVIPKESLFIEDQKSASASIQLDLRSNLPPAKLAAIVHLVANAVEGLEPEQVAVVDTKGRLIFKGGDKGDTASLISNTQLEYKREVENEIRKNVQTMLEGIVGVGKAIVRVNAAIDYNKITLNEEEYDPSATAIRSKRDIEESTRSNKGDLETANELISQRSGIAQPSTGNQNQRTKKDSVTNYEINKITRTILKPAGTIQRLSVAAVIDGIYKTETLKDGTTKKQYIPRSEEDLKKFEEIVKKAMGYNEDREDRVTVSSISFSESDTLNATVKAESEKFDIVGFAKNYGKTFANFILVIVVFFFIIKPLLKSVRNIAAEALINKELPVISGDAHLYGSGDMSPRQKIIEISQGNPEKTKQLIKGWVSEQEG